jgi:tryptophan synthase alpha subunit
MKRIEKRFAQLKEKREKALVAYLTAGYPDLETTRDLVPALDAAGVDVLELGVPFSDPTADGPAIQRASQEALRNGTTLSQILSLSETFGRPRTCPSYFSATTTRFSLAGPSGSPGKRPQPGRTECWWWTFRRKSPGN